MPEPFRDSLWNIPDWAVVVMYVSQAVGVLAMIYGFARRVGLYFEGKRDWRPDALGKRLRHTLVYAVGQAKLATQRFPGLMHALMFWAFVVLFMGTVLATIDQDIMELFFDAKLLRGSLYQFYEVTLDLFGLFFLIGLGMAFKRRYVDRSVRLSYDWGWGLMLGLLFAINLTGFLIEALRLAVVQPAWQGWSPVGYAMGLVFNALPLGEGALRGTHVALWLLHALLVMVFWGVLPYTPLVHLVTSPLNVFLARIEPRSQALRPIPNMEEAESWGAGSLGDFTWRERLMFDACTECGRCQVVCPAWNAGTPLNPKYIIVDLRNQMLAEGGLPHSAIGGFGEGYNPNIRPGAELVGEVISDDRLWSCTTCRACVYECPVFIEHVDVIVEMRRYLVMDQGRMPDSINLTLRNLERTHNPWGNPPSDRMKWAEGLDVPIMREKQEAEYLYWVGCAASYDVRNQKIARAFVRLLQQAGVDFAVLGPEETCNGDPARRMGNEYLFQMMAERVIEKLNKYTFKKIVTACPHCFNVFKNEYPQFGGEYDVVHHSELLAELVAQGRLKPTRAVNEVLTFHDSCYLGRYNGILDAPREVLAAVPGVQLREMPRSRERGLCCGGGGAGVWNEPKGERRIEEIRLEEAMSLEPDTVASACPFCMIMFDSGAKTMGIEERVRLRDVAEVLAEAVGVEEEVPA